MRKRLPNATIHWLAEEKNEAQKIAKCYRTILSASDGEGRIYERAWIEIGRESFPHCQRRIFFSLALLGVRLVSADVNKRKKRPQQMNTVHSKVGNLYIFVAPFMAYSGFSAKHS